MVIVSSPGDPIDDEIEVKSMFSKVFSCQHKHNKTYLNGLTGHMSTG